MMARHELRECRLVPRRGRSNELPDLGPHHAHHAIEIRPGGGLIPEASGSWLFEAFALRLVTRLSVGGQGDRSLRFAFPKADRDVGGRRAARQARRPGLTGARRRPRFRTYR